MVAGFAPTSESSKLPILLLDDSILYSPVDLGRPDYLIKFIKYRLKSQIKKFLLSSLLHKLTLSLQISLRFWHFVTLLLKPL